jgi:hypothetical protein
MIHSETHIVTEDSVRKAGKQDECFYCNNKLGDLHKLDCVCRDKTVVVRATIEYVVKVPEFWDDYNIECHRNESSWCSDNIIGELEELEEKHGCLCNFVNFEYVREATKEDEEKMG